MGALKKSKESKKFLYFSKGSKINIISTIALKYFDQDALLLQIMQILTFLKQMAYNLIDNSC